MQTLKRIISSYMRRITWILLAALLVIITYIQLINEQRRAYDSSTRTFAQIEQVLLENQHDLIELQQEYRQTCLHNAETIDRIIEGEPDILYNVEELKEIARCVEVDEIHIFDETGRIFAGTHPQYFGYTFDSGEQIRFFKPMLQDKNLKLVQDITPNTAENKMMQYSALWSDSGKFIVQVGMEPVNIIKITEKNELSHIFSLFRVHPEANYYAISAENWEVVGSTELECVGKKSTEIGFSIKDVMEDPDGFHANVNGKHAFCVFKKMGENYIGRIVLSRELYQRVPTTILALAICLATIAFCLAQAVIKYMDKYIIKGIKEINEKLSIIAKGNLDEIVDIRTSAEFSELSDYINTMVHSLFENTRKMSYVLTKTEMYIGVYEYNKESERVHFTEYIPRIFGIDEFQAERLSADYKVFAQFIDKICENTVPDETSVFKVSDYPERYVRLEEIVDNQVVFGVAIDATAEIMKRKKIEVERDIDQLTGLYNRRGLETKLSVLFSEPEKLGYGAIIMIDADGLKAINDTYGHEMGDVYLIKIAGIIKNFGLKNSVAARQGGDEYVLFLYQYDGEDELVNTIRTLEYIQNHSSAHLNEEVDVPLRFSFGYSFIKGKTDYQKLIKEADEKMYENKRERKKEQVNN